MLGIGCGIATSFFNPKTGGAPAYTFLRTAHFDGVNDHATVGGGSPAVSGTCFNPYNDVDWFVACYLKSGTGGRFTNNSSVFGVRQFVGTYAQAKLQFINATGGSNMRIKTSTVSITSTYVIPTASQTDWHHYAATIDVSIGVNVTVKFYVDSVLVDTQVGTQTTVVDTTVNLTIGAARNADYFSGYINQMVLGYGVPPTSSIETLWNDGKGSDPAVSLSAYTFAHYAFTEAAGTTTGPLVDTEGGDSVGLVGVLSPYGLITDSPA